MSLKKIFFKINLLAINFLIATSLCGMNIELENMEIPPNFEEVEIQQPQRRNYNEHSIDFSAGGSEDFTPMQVQPTPNKHSQDYSFDYDLPPEEQSLFTKVQPKNKKMEKFAGHIAQFIPAKKKSRQKIFNNFKLVSKTFYRKLYEHRINKIKIKNVAHKKNKQYSKKLDFSFLINMLETSGWLEINHKNIIRFFAWKSPYTGEQPDRRKKTSTVQELKKAIEKHNKTRKTAIKKRKQAKKRLQETRKRKKEEKEQQRKREIAKQKKEEREEAIQEFCNKLGKGCVYCLALPAACIFFSAAGTCIVGKKTLHCLDKCGDNIMECINENKCCNAMDNMFEKTTDALFENNCCDAMDDAVEKCFNGTCCNAMDDAVEKCFNGTCCNAADKIFEKIFDLINESCCCKIFDGFTNWCMDCDGD